MQRAAARFCTNDYNWPSSVTSMLNKLDLCTLEERRRRSRLIFMHKIIHGLVDIKIETHTRSSLRLKLLEPHCKKGVFKLSFFLRTARDWNQLLPDMPRILSLEEFKNYHK